MKWIRIGSEEGLPKLKELVVLYITDPAELNFNSPYALARAFASMPKAIGDQLSGPGIEWFTEQNAPIPNHKVTHWKIGRVHV